MDRNRWEDLKHKIHILGLSSDCVEEIEADLYITDEETKSVEEEPTVDYSHFYVASDTWRCKICKRGKHNTIHTKDL